MDTRTTSWIFGSWVRHANTAECALNLHEELVQLRARLKAQDKEIRRLKKENDFLEEASAFFAASRLKSTKTNV